jgi:hypothetical protein
MYKQRLDHIWSGRFFGHRQVIFILA